MVKRVRLFVATSYLLAILLWLTEPFAGAPELAVVIAIACPIGIVLGIVIAQWQNTRPRVKRLMECQRIVKLDGDWLEFHGADESGSRSKLTDYHHAREVTDFFAIYPSWMSYFPVPHSAFKSADDIAAFRCKLKEAGLLG